MSLEIKFELQIEAIGSSISKVQYHNDSHISLFWKPFKEAVRGREGVGGSKSFDWEISRLVSYNKQQYF